MNRLKYKNDLNDNQIYLEMGHKIDRYFSINKIQKSANSFAKIKAFVLLLLYLCLQISIFIVDNSMQLFSIYLLMGCLTVFIALNIGHDGGHNAFFKSRKKNKLLLYVFDFLGASGLLWEFNHNASHHTHPNIQNEDADLKNTGILIRIFSEETKYKFHQFQYLYAPFLYLLVTINWFLIKDFQQFFLFMKNTNYNSEIKSKELTIFLFGKSLLIVRLIILPLIFTQFTIWTILASFIILTLSSSVAISVGIMCAHLVDETSFETADKNMQINNSWMRHQIASCSDYSTKNKWVSHLYGGFNHHLAHHLFPRISNVHYPIVTRIISKTCSKYDIKYNSHKSIAFAMKSHFKFLKNSGTQSEHILDMTL